MCVCVCVGGGDIVALRSCLNCGAWSRFFSLQKSSRERPGSCAGYCMCCAEYSAAEKFNGTDIYISMG